MTRPGPISDASIRHYYDANTRRFLVVGGSGPALAMHRPLWGDGVTTTEAAAAHINDVVGALAERHLGRMPGQVRDLGCGVGGTVFHLAARWPDAALTGITISDVQRDRAEQEARKRGLSQRCDFVQGDFTEPSDQSFTATDLAIAIESHVHAPSAAAFLAGAAGVVRPDGLLVVVDDMLLQPEAALPTEQQRRLAAFRQGWRLGHVPDRDGFQNAAAQAGFEVVETIDLTDLIHLDRLRDRALHVVGPLAQRMGLNRWPIFGNMIGGDALTRLYKTGTIRYTCTVLRRTSA